MSDNDDQHMPMSSESRAIWAKHSAEAEQRENIKYEAQAIQEKLDDLADMAAGCLLDKAPVDPSDEMIDRISNRAYVIARSLFEEGQRQKAYCRELAAKIHRASQDKADQQVRDLEDL